MNRNAIIEECAKILDHAADDWRRIRDPGMANNAASYARKIRTLKSATSEQSAGTLLTAAEALLREIELVPAGRDYRPYYRLRNSSQLNDPDAAVIGLREAVEAAGGKTKIQRVRA